MHRYLVHVAISWGNKINFSLFANMSSGFCSDSHLGLTIDVESLHSHEVKRA